MLPHLKFFVFFLKHPGPARSPQRGFWSLCRLFTFKLWCSSAASTHLGDALLLLGHVDDAGVGVGAAAGAAGVNRRDCR